MACLHGYAIGGGVLRLEFEPRIKSQEIRNWIMGHPRIVLPALVAILGFVTASFFDPVREWCIRNYITHSYSVHESTWLQWLRHNTLDILRTSSHDSKIDGSQYFAQSDNVESIRTWMSEPQESFIVVQGPRGSGKRALVLRNAVKSQSK